MIQVKFTEKVKTNKGKKNSPWRRNPTKKTIYCFYYFFKRKIQHIYQLKKNRGTCLLKKRKRKTDEEVAESTEGEEAGDQIIVWSRRIE